VTPHHRALESALVDPELSDQVDMVLRPEAPDTYRATTSDGSVTFQRRADDGRWRYEIVDVEGTDPLADQRTDHLVGLEAELADPHPERDANAFPHAFDHIAQFFDGDHAPDLLVQHTAHHHFDAHVGQHGSLGITQARAPFIAAGPRIAHRGLVDLSARMVDVAPTIAAVLGLSPHPEGIGPTGERRPDALLRRQDGDVMDLVDTDTPPADHVVVFLLDGTNANVLYDAIERGEAPRLASLLARGTGLRHGVLASLPTATLANHTTANTGAHPGHSGVLHNTWYDRHRDHAPDLLAMDQMFTAMIHLDPGVETLHQAVHRCRPGAFTTAAFEFCDTGADASSFDPIRRGVAPRLPSMEQMAHANQRFGHASGSYAFMSGVDEAATLDTLRWWSRAEGNPLPTFSWLSLSLTDEAGHEGGPHSEMARAAIAESDHRVGRVIDAVEAVGVTERTTFVVLADHGMQLNDVTNTASWTPALEATGVDHHQVADNLLYLR